MPRLSRGHLLDRRSFLALAGGTVLARGSARSETAVPASLAIAYDDPGRAISPDFIGLSYESALIAAPDYFSPDNYSLLGLIRALGARGVIRVGGNTSERTVWETGAERQNSGRYVITPAAVDLVAAVMRQVDLRRPYWVQPCDHVAERRPAAAPHVAPALGSGLLACPI